MDEGQSRYGLIRDTGSAHWYDREGKPQHHTNVKGAKRHGYYPSVTSYLKVWPKPALDRWKIEQAILAAITLPRNEGEEVDAFAKRVAHDMTEEVTAAARIGTDLHAIMNTRMVEGRWPVDMEELRPWMEAYEPWVQSELTKVWVSEVVLTHPEWGYAGTVDLVADTRQWGHAVLDFKNQNVRPAGPAFYDEWLMQLIAYAKAWELDSKREVENIVSLVLDRNQAIAPYVYVWPKNQWEQAWRKFQSCMQLWCLWKEYDPLTWEPPPPRKNSRKPAQKEMDLDDHRRAGVH